MRNLRNVHELVMSQRVEEKLVEENVICEINNKEFTLNKGDYFHSEDLGITQKVVSVTKSDKLEVRYELQPIKQLDEDSTSAYRSLLETLTHEDFENKFKNNSLLNIPLFGSTSRLFNLLKKGVK